jgi:hypothetical protein
MNSTFDSRLLYTQTSEAVIDEQEPVTVSSSVYAIRFLYPGAAQHTTGRLRITCTYRNTVQFEAHAGVIERWTDKGWIILDDYTDKVFAFTSEITFRKRLLDYSHAFVLGIPLSMIDSRYLPDSIPYTTPLEKTKRSFSVNSKKPALKKDDKNTALKDNYKKTEKDIPDEDSDDDDDLDWL